MTRLEETIIKRSKKLRPISPTEKKYGEKMCDKRIIAFYNKCYCSECGAVIGMKKDIVADNDEDNRYLEKKCKECHSKLTGVVVGSAKGGTESYYYDIVTTNGEYQLIRHSLIYKTVYPGKKPSYSHYEVIQNWITDYGKEIIIARDSKPFTIDGWSLSSEMKIKRKITDYYGYSRYDIEGYLKYPRQRFIPILKRNGAVKTIGTPNRFCMKLIKDPLVEKVLKMGQEKVVREMVNLDRDPQKWMNQIRICTRHGYKIEDYGLWVDYLEYLEELGKDLNSPAYLCPNDLRLAHDVMREKVAREHERIRMEENRRKARRLEKYYKKKIEPFIGLHIEGKGIDIEPLRTVSEFLEEGEHMHHCVFDNGYYKKADCLIMSAKSNGERLETIEVSLRTFKIVQSRGVCNSDSKRHGDILALVNQNMNKIKKLTR